MKKLIYMMSFLLAMTSVWTGCSKDGDSPVEEFTVSFDSKGGSAVNLVKVNKGNKIARPANPANGTLIFVDWFKEAACTNVWSFDSDVVIANITLYAKWTTVEYTVTFNTNGGSVIAPVKVAEGSTLQPPLPPSKGDGAAFENWYKDAALTTVYDFSSPVRTNSTLYAKWTTVTRETLQALVNDVDEINQNNYTEASCNAMRAKGEAAYLVLDNPEATSAQIITAYTELQAAINALEALPVKEAISIEISTSIIDGFVYVTPGEHVRLSAYAIDAHENEATDSRVTFTYNESQLNGWADGSILISDNYMDFDAKSPLTAGQTVSITIKSVSKPAVSTTVILKVAVLGAFKAQFLAIVNALPAPELISYEHIKNISKAEDLYDALTSHEQQETEVQTAYSKLRECDYRIEDLPQRYDYSFSGNVCTLTVVDFDTEHIKLNFIANGSFPQGTYTTTEWMDYEADGKYSQDRLIFKSGGNGVSETRTSKNADGSNPTAWEKDDELTYTFTGTQAKGGRFTIAFDDEKIDPATPSSPEMSVAKTGSRTTTVFRR